MKSVLYSFIFNLEKLTKICLALINIILFIGMFIIKFYLNVSRDLERLDEVSRSPIIDLLTETIHGVITIGAHEKEKGFLQLLYSKLIIFLKLKYAKLGCQRGLLKL
jgi:hypothetical protein